MLKLTKLISDKRFSLSCALIATISILVLSLMKTDQFPSIEIEATDKVYHILAYFALTLSWHFHYTVTHLQKAKIKVLLRILLLIIGFGIVIEILQNSVTSYRTFDLKDIYANTFGSGIATLIFVAVLEKIKNKIQKFR